MAVSCGCRQLPELRVCMEVGTGKNLPVRPPAAREGISVRAQDWNLFTKIKPRPNTGNIDHLITPAFTVATGLECFSSSVGEEVTHPDLFHCPFMLFPASSWLGPSPAARPRVGGRVWVRLDPCSTAWKRDTPGFLLPPPLRVPVSDPVPGVRRP